MSDPLHQVQKRSFQYWFIDGIPEIALGVLFLALSGYYYLQYAIPHDTLARTLLDGGFLIFFLAFWYGTGRFVQYAKQRITYPRTGYIAYHQKPKSRRWVAALTAMLIASSVGALLVAAPPTISWMPLISSVMVALMSLIFGWRAGLARFYFLALLTLVIGIMISARNLDNILSLSLVFLLWAPCLIVSGAVTLVRYLRGNPVAMENPDVR